MPTYRLNTKVAILSKVRNPLSDFEPQAEKWVLHASAWVQIVPRRAEERISGDQVDDVTRHLVYMRFDSGVMPGMRLEHAGQQWDIHTATDIDDRHEYLELMVTECQMK